MLINSFKQCLLLACLTAVVGEVIVYKNHLISSEQPEFLIVPKYSPKDIPSWSPGNGRSYIDISRLKLSSTCDSAKSGSVCASRFEILMFEAPTDKHWTDYWDMDEFCCSEELANAGKCKTPNRLIQPKDLSAAVVRSAVVSSNGALEEEVEIAHLTIKKSGLYVLLMAVCTPDASPVRIDGSVDSLDPYGYVPADLFGDLPFYFSLSCMYTIIGATWLVLCAFFSDQLMPLQMWITAVLAVGMLETTLLFAHYLNWNDAGVPALPVTVLGLLLGVAKRATSRVLVMLVSLGYGVVRPSLGEDLMRVLYLGGAYAALSLVYTLMDKLPSNDRLASNSAYDMMSMVVFLLAVVDTSFYIWIFSSINNLLLSLASRKQGVKYMLYRNFRAVLFTLLGLTCAWALYGTLLFMNDTSGTNSNWRLRWSVDALWELIYFSVLVAIAVMWAPSKNSQRYAYSMELTQLEDDEEYQEAVTNAAAAVSCTKTDRDRDNDGTLDDEYGGRLQDEQDPFQGTGALDPAMAISKSA